MCIFGMFQPQKKAAGFMPGDTADVDTDTTLVTGKDVKGIGGGGHTVTNMGLGPGE